MITLQFTDVIHLCMGIRQDGFTAVHWAAIKGRLEVLKYLVELAPENNRADPTIPDRDGWTALTWAVFSAESAGKGDVSEICKWGSKEI